MRIYADAFYSEREELIRETVGERLDTLRSDLEQLDSPCASKLFNLPQKESLTIEELLSIEAKDMQQILSTLLYCDAYWRLEAAYLMFRIGLLNVTYSNLRSCVENVVAAHIIENLDDEAKSFLTRGEVNPTKIASFIPEEYNKQIIEIKRTLSNWGVHSHLNSIQLGSLFSPNVFEKMVSKTSAKRKQALNPDFVEAAKTCMQAFGSVFLIFMFLMNKGTSYKV